MVLIKSTERTVEQAIKELQALGATLADPNEKVRQLSVLISGKEKHGKTSFALSAPSPLLYIYSDPGCKGVLQKYAADKPILRHQFSVPEDQDEARVMWNDMFKVFSKAVHIAKGICVDTGTELWALARMAYLGKLTQVKGHHYGPVNAIFVKLVKQIVESGSANVIFVQKLKPVYLNDQRTKDYETSGFGDMRFIVDVVAEVYRDDPVYDTQGNPVPGSFHLVIRDCRQNADLQGQVLDDAMVQFPILASMVLPDVDPAQWV